MKALINENNKKYDLVFLAIFIAITVRFCIYIYIAAAGSLSLIQYFPIIINLLMYFSIGKYMVDYFKKGKDVSIESMLVRFGAAMVSTIISAKDGNDIVFIMIAIVIFLVPYMAGKLRNPKTGPVLMIVIMALCIAIAVFQIINPPDGYLYGLDKRIFILDTINPCVQWLMFSILYYVRGFIYLDSQKVK